jgi:hypothetical protein
MNMEINIYLRKNSDKREFRNKKMTAPNAGWKNNSREFQKVV